MGAPAEATIGRDAELVMIEQFLDAVATGSGALVIDGDPGIGKSTLWDAAVEHARQRGRRLLLARPTEAETDYAFAGLIDLLDPIADDELAGLPAPQRLALQVALLRRDASEPVQAGAISVALVGLVRALASAGPLVIAIDDVDWLDQPTSSAVTFLVRRLGTGRVGVVVTCRTGSTWAERVRRPPHARSGTNDLRLRVGPLAPRAMYQVVRDRLGVALPRPLLARIHEVSAGNPLFAIELTRASMEQDELPRAGQPLPVPAGLTDLLRARLTRLPAATRDALLVAAADSDPTLDRLARVLDLPGGSAASVLEPAERAGVVRSAAGTVRFSHPLLAAAVYTGATRSRVRQVHQRLAMESDGAEDRARHLAIATTTPDPEVAAALDDGAARARARGASGIAAQLAEQALNLSPPARPLIQRRSLTAGLLAASAGDPVRAEALLERAVAWSDAGTERAEAMLHLAEVSSSLRRGRQICDEALGEAGDDAALLSRIHRVRGHVSYYLGDVLDAEVDARIAVSYAEAADDPNALSSALGELGHWTFCGGGGIANELIDRGIALDSSARATSPRSHFATVMVDACFHAESRPMLDKLVAESLRVGDLRAAAVHLFRLAELEMWSGNWSAAIANADESLMLRQEADQPIAPLYVRALCEANLGRLDEAERQARLGLIEAERTEDIVFQLGHLHVLGFVELSRGAYEAAHGHLGHATDLLRTRWSREFGGTRFLPDEIESVVALGDLERAEDLVTWMETVGQRTGRSWTLATGWRCRAILSAARGDLRIAEQAIAESLAAHDDLPMPFELARTLLTKGVIERRARRRAKARASMTRARGIFSDLGAVVWAAKASAELDRLGIRTVAQRDLTPVERRIAGLVADGRTNREIATELFVSPKTVEANLSHIFQKLDLRSRTELARWASRHGVSASDEPRSPVGFS